MAKKGVTKEGFTKANVARQYRDKYGMEMPIRTLARILIHNEPLVFKDFEDARGFLRKIEGKSGGKGHITVTHPYPKREINPYKLPESDERDWQPFILKDAKRVGLLSDIHVPYHSISAITAGIDKFIQFGIDTLILNGDIIDCYTLSRFEKDPRKRNFSEELDIFANLIKSLKDALNCRIVYKLGNHEERYDNFLLRKAPELFGIPELSLEMLINQRTGLEIEIIKDKRIIQANALDIIHGHEFAQGFFSPVNIARGLALRAKTNAIQGHNHQTSEHTEKDLRGEIKTTWSTGCCCELHPEFMPINKWNHGFAILELDNASREFSLENFRVVNGKAM